SDNSVIRLPLARFEVRPTGEHLRLDSSYTTALYDRDLQRIYPELAEAGVHALAFHRDSDHLVVLGNTAENPQGFTVEHGRLAESAASALGKAQRGIGGVWNDLSAIQDLVVREIADGRGHTVIRAYQFDENGGALSGELRAFSARTAADVIQGHGGIAAVDQQEPSVLGYVPRENGLAAAGDLKELYKASMRFQPDPDVVIPHEIPEHVQVLGSPTAHAVVSPFDAILPDLGVDTVLEQRLRAAVEALNTAERLTAEAVNERVAKMATPGKRSIFRGFRRMAPLSPPRTSRHGLPDSYPTDATSTSPTNRP
ncbi:MAG: hypothetical protein ACREP9_14800, partial [Candidatus Dormibacteraceae bacterium]